MSTEALKQQLVPLLPRLRRYALSLTRNASDADELLQNACLRALSRAHQWDDTQPLSRWMFRITHNIWISETRKRRVRVGQGTVPADETIELKTIATGESHAMAKDIRQKVAALPVKLSTTLMLVTVEGYSYKEASALLDVPVGTIMSRVSRARRLLQESLAA